MSVTFVRSGQMMPGKFREAQAFVQKRRQWLADTYGIEPSIMTQLGGPVGRVAIVSEVDSVAKIEEIRRQIIEGALPAELAAGPEGLFIPGETMGRGRGAGYRAFWTRCSAIGPSQTRVGGEILCGRESEFRKIEIWLQVMAGSVPTRLTLTALVG